MAAEDFLDSEAEGLLEKLHVHRVELVNRTEELRLAREEIRLRDAKLARRSETISHLERGLALQTTALSTIANAVMIADTRGIIRWVNPAFASLTGYSSQEAIGDTPRLLQSGEHSPEFYKDLWDTILAGNTWQGTFINRRKDGSLYHDEHTITPFRSKEGVITHFIAIMNDVTARQRAERQVTLLEACVSNLNDIVVITEAEPLDEPGPRIVFVNKAFERLTGYTSAEAIGKSPRLLQGEKTSRAALDEIRQALVQRKPIRKSIFNYGKDGTEYWLEIDIAPIYDAGGNCTHFAAIERDITVQMKTELNAARLAALVSSSDDAIIGKDLNGIITSWNRGAEKIFGYTAAEMVGTSIMRLIPAGGREEENMIMSKIRNGESVEHFETIRETNDGRLIEVSITASPIIDNAGNIVGVSKVARNITEKNRIKEHLAEQAELLDKAQDAIIVRDLNGGILYWNHGAERMYGWTRQEVEGHDMGLLMHRTPEQFEEIKHQVLQRGEWAGDLQHLGKDRRELTVQSRWTLVRNRQGTPKSILAINTDITDKKKIEAQFMRAQRMESIGTLAGGIAHDLNNILAPIMMSIDMLKGAENDPQRRDILETIEISAKRGADIVRQVLSFARGLEGARVEVQPKHLLLDLQRIINETFPKDIRLKFTVPNDIWTILGDPTQVHQILLNLSVNARDAMPNGGVLSIGVENAVLDEQYVAMNIQAKPGRYVVLSVADTGTGMPPEVVDKIFEPFFTTKDLNKGTGLGLSTVMAIVKSHEGVINVYSEVGKGTTFKIYLPAMEMTSEGRDEQTKQATLPRGHGETILVIDDEASILTITSQTLQAFGYRVLTATDGADAMTVYAEHKKDIAAVITDMMMPLMDGPATIQALTRINPKIKIVATSGLNANGGVVHASGAGVNHFLTKPYTAGALLKTLRTILEEA